MKFDGNFEVSAPIDQAWQSLQHVAAVAACIPGAEDVRPSGTDEYAGTIRARIGPIAATFDLVGALKADSDTRLYDVAITGKDRLTGTIVQATFAARLEPTDVGTRLDYQLDLTLRGKLGQMGDAVFHDVAEKMTRLTVDCLKARLEAGATA